MNLSIQLICLFLPSLILLSFGLIIITQNFYTAPYVPSSPWKLRALLKQLQLDSKSRFIDIGSGDGSTVLVGSEFFAKSTGIDMNPHLWVLSNIRKLFHSNKAKINFIYGSFFNIPFNEYDVMYIYLFPEVMEKLEDKIFSEMPKGSTIISHTFSFKKHQPVEKLNKHYLIYKV